MHRSSLLLFFVQIHANFHFPTVSVTFFFLSSFPDFFDMLLVSRVRPATPFFNHVCCLFCFVCLTLAHGMVLATALLLYMYKLEEEKRGPFPCAYICYKPLFPFTFFPLPSWLWPFELWHKRTKTKKTCRLGNGNQEVHELDKIADGTWRQNNNKKKKIRPLLPFVRSLPFRTTTLYCIPA